MRTAHPIGAAAGVANLKLIDDLQLVGNSAEVGAYLLARLRDALSGHPNVAEIRGVGMLAAVELAEDPASRKFFDPAAKIGPTVAANLLAEGVIARAMPQGDILGFAPPLCLNREEADQIVGALAKVFGQMAF